MVTQAEHAQQLRDLKDQLTKAHGEITNKISELEAAIAAGGGTTPEVDTLMQELKDLVQLSDDVVSDTPPDPVP